MNRIDRKFRELKKQKRKAFITFITAGYPSLKITEKLIYEFSRRGVDIIELGVPFSDPLADGPMIQESSQYALGMNTHLGDILSLVLEVRKRTDIPICLMTYYNPVFCFGEKKFIRQAKRAGVDGIIIPDLPPEEAVALRKEANRAGLAIIFFIAPTTSLKRIKFISRVSRGFIYYVSLTGVTGARKRLPRELLENLKRVSMQVNRPLCVGFGISSPQQIKQISRVSSGVIVGSAIVRKIKQNLKDPNLVNRVGSFISSLKNV